MPKILKPQEAMPIAEGFEHIMMEANERLKGTGKYSDASELTNISTHCNSILEMVNSDTCINQSQLTSLFTLFRRHMYKLSEKGNHDIDPMKRDLVGYINSFRFDCFNCLNEMCKFRDPDYPVDEVKERAGQFEVTEK